MTATEQQPSSSSEDSELPDPLAEAFDRTVQEGVRRLGRTIPQLLATGAVGGADVVTGVFALLIVKQATGNELLGALAFSIGFIALTLANSELFTENFLVPIAALAARQTRLTGVLRLWGGTAAANLVFGWLIMGLVISGFPRLGPTSVEIARHYPEIGIGWRSFAGALLGGAVITLMTWMERGTESVTGKLAAAVAAAFLLASAPLNHVIVVSLEMFGALHHGAPFGYLDWLTVSCWYTLGNVIGGVGMVTGLRLIQIGEERLEAARQKIEEPRDSR